MSLVNPKISLGSGPTVHHVDLIFILRRSHGRRRKSELAALRNCASAVATFLVSKPDVTQQRAPSAPVIATGLAVAIGLCLFGTLVAGLNLLG